MANKKYKLANSDYWETSGVYDLTEGKTQRAINAEVKGSLTPLSNLYNTITWAIGSLGSAIGNEVSATNQIRSSFIRCKTGTRIICASGYNFYVFVYDKDTAAFIEHGGAWQTVEYVVTSDCYIRVLLRKADQSAISAASDISDNIYIGDYEIGAKNVIESIQQDIANIKPGTTQSIPITIQGFTGTAYINKWNNFLVFALPIMGSHTYTENQNTASIGTLPAGYRPTGYRTAVVMINNIPVTLEFRTNGDIVFVKTPAGTYDITINAIVPISL